MITVKRLAKKKWEFAWDPAADAAIDVLDEGWESRRTGDMANAAKAFKEALTMEPDLIDAYAGLGNIEFDQRRWKAARSYYEKGVQIGLRVLPPEFDGTLPWGLVHNRPFLRALHGLGLTLSETGDHTLAQVIYRWGLRLNPDDNQGLRFLVDELIKGKV